MKLLNLLIIPMLVVMLACQTKTPPGPQSHTSFERTSSGPLAQRETRVMEATATVTNINYGTRKITIVNSQGKKNTITASDKVRRLNEIKKGDNVVVKYYESLAYEVRKPTPEEQVNPRTAAMATKKASKMLPPGIGVGALSHTIVTIKNIDRQAETVSVMTPEGKMVTVKARYPENLERIKVGDTVAVTYAEAIAISVDPIS